MPWSRDLNLAIFLRIQIYNHARFGSNKEAFTNLTNRLSNLNLYFKSEGFFNPFVLKPTIKHYRF